MTDPSALALLTAEQREALALTFGRQIPYLSVLGQRLLADLADRCTSFGRGDGLPTESVLEFPPQKDFGKAPAEIIGPLLAIAVIRGAVRATAYSGPAVQVDLPIGVYGRHDAGLQQVEVGKLKLDPAGQPRDEQLRQGGDLYLVANPSLLAVSPILASRVIKALPKELQAPFERYEQRELIWFDSDSAHEELLRPMVHILATAAAMSERHTAILDFGYERPVRKWNGQSFVGEPFDPTVHLRDLLPAGEPGSLYVVVTPNTPFPQPISDEKFDRIVYLSEGIPARLPEHLGKRLHEALFDADLDKEKCEPYFVSFVPTRVVRSTHSARNQSRFRALPMAHGRIEKDEDKTPRGLRPYRDACIVPIHRAALRRAWAEWLPHSDEEKAATFLSAAVSARALRIETAERWARAVAIRRTGVALSGGGASAYRFVPVLARLERAHVPIDVFAGLSGGALLGAYYCTGGMKGVRRFVKLAPIAQATLPLTFWTTALYEQTLNFVLENARVENLEVRLGMITVALPDGGPPYGAVITEASIGQAARASGTLPPSYAPTEINRIRYTDGGACTFVPARIARDCGADVILSCNAIPGPDNCNPFPTDVYGTLLSRWLRRLPLWDRLIDAQSWRSFQWQQASRVFGEMSDAFLEFPPSSISPLEPTLFLYARQIIAAAAKEPELPKSIQGFSKAWRKLRYK